MDFADIKTTYWAPEIERSLVAILWHHPRFVDFVHLNLDPEIHFLDPILRTVLELISVVYWQFGRVDWASVIHALREVDEIEACGGRQGLNDIFTDDGHYPESRGNPNPSLGNTSGFCTLTLFSADKSDPTKPVYQFMGGKRKIRPNKVRRLLIHWRRRVFVFVPAGCLRERGSVGDNVSACQSAITALWQGARSPGKFPDHEILSD